MLIRFTVGWSWSQLSDCWARGILDKSPFIHREHRDKLPFMLTFTPCNLEWPINLLSACLWTVGEYPERIHAGAGRTSKPHTERPQSKLEPVLLDISVEPNYSNDLLLWLPVCPWWNGLTGSFLKLNEDKKEILLLRPKCEKETL